MTVNRTSALTDRAAIERAIEEIINALSYLDSNANAKLVIGVLGMRLSKA